MEKCEICNKKLTDKEIDKNIVMLCDWEMYFCDKHYKELNKILKETKKDYKHIEKKNWALFCKIQEWRCIEYIYEKKTK